MPWAFGRGPNRTGSRIGWPIQPARGEEEGQEDHLAGPDPGRVAQAAHDPAAHQSRSAPEEVFPGSREPLCSMPDPMVRGACPECVGLVKTAIRAIPPRRRGHEGGPGESWASLPGRSHEEPVLGFSGNRMGQDDIQGGVAPTSGSLIRLTLRTSGWA